MRSGLYDLYSEYKNDLSKREELMPRYYHLQALIQDREGNVMPPTELGG